ncbi:galactosyl transferase GMA12/MNN10 family-domain-containing protein [Geopyxis carbonaria]|nr:galactosyl transferase GMA12/MNN10 family-domain-containing protein [Geopyxis carbonaria]
MHFALPTRGNSRSSPFLNNSVSRKYPIFRKPIYAIVLVVVIIFLLVRTFTGDSIPADAPHTVLVLVLNRTSTTATDSYIDKVIENRQEYARAHGYGLFIKNVGDYPTGNVPQGWARIPAIRHAMTEFKYSEYFWYLDQNAIIMNPALSLEEHITNPARLNTLIRRDVPVVPPESVIKTYKHVPAERIHFILSQDHEGLQPGSMIIRAGEWSKYLLDAWYDPMFRFYNFQKAETHALEHIVQWHPTILTKLALIPQKIMNSYPTPIESKLAESGDAIYEKGDFVVHFHNCWNPGRSCEKEFMAYWNKRSTVS